MAYTCTGGLRSGPDPSTWTFVSIPSGTYASLTVAGVCQTAPGTVIHVLGDVNVAAGAVLDAQSAPSTITVGHNVTAAAGSLLGLGCQPDYPDNTGHPCVVEADGHSTIKVEGNVTGTGVDTVLLNGIKVEGNITLIGGGGDIPWSIKNNRIGRDLTVSGVTVDWLGVLFNEIEGSVTLTDITVNDPERPEPGPDPSRLRRSQQHRKEPQLHGTRARRVRRFRWASRRGQRRRRQRDRAVRIPDCATLI